MVMQDLLTEKRKKMTIENLWGNADGIATDWRVVDKVISYRNSQINRNDYRQAALDKAVDLWNKGRITII